MSFIKKSLCGLFLALFLLCLVQIRRYEPEIIKISGSPGTEEEFSPDETGPVDVVVDPGHGGMDGGTSGGGILEKRWALRLGQELAAELRSRGLGVAMTREQDQAVSLERRCRIAEASGARAFVSVHFNYSHLAMVSGFETYFSWPKSLAAAATLRRSLGIGDGVSFRDQRGEMLARSIQEAVVEEAGIRDRGARNSRFWVTRNISLPAVLLECGFLSNEAERVAYDDHRYRRRVVCAIADALEDFLLRDAESAMLGIELEAK